MENSFKKCLGSAVWSVSVAVGISAIATIASTGIAAAGPLCSSLGPPGGSIESFVSCTADGQDTLSNVQAALDFALDPNITLIGTGSFSSGSGTGNEFFGSRPEDGFVISETDLMTDTFTFEMLPVGTEFVTLKQGSGFEVFNVMGKSLPFSLTHMLGGGATSHISTFVSDYEPTLLVLENEVPVPEPGTLALFGLGLAGLGFARRKKAA